MSGGSEIDDPLQWDSSLSARVLGSVATETHISLEEEDSGHKERDTLMAFFGYFSGLEIFVELNSKNMTTVAHGKVYGCQMSLCFILFCLFFLWCTALCPFFAICSFLSTWSFYPDPFSLMWSLFATWSFLPTWSFLSVWLIVSAQSRSMYIFCFLFAPSPVQSLCSTDLS